jgi:hypothetical protein
VVYVLPSAGSSQSEEDVTMPDDKTPEEIQAQFMVEVAALRDQSAKSTDPLLVAKATAAADLGMQQVVLSRLGSGERLVEVFAQRGSGQTEIQVFFRFTPANETTHLLDTGVLAFVDTMKGEVVGRADPYTLQAERRVGRPLVAVSALKAEWLGSVSQPGKPLAEREQAYFKDLGLANLIFGGGGGRGPTETACPTNIATTSDCPGPGGRLIIDDTGREAASDACDSIA